MNAEFLMLLGGSAAFLLTLYWVRRRDLREKYAVGWTVVAVIILLFGFFPDLIKSFAEAVHLSNPSAVLFVALGAIYIFAFLMTVALTRQYRKNMRLNQEIGILEARVRHLEDLLNTPRPDTASPGPPA